MRATSVFLATLFSAAALLVAGCSPTASPTAPPKATSAGLSPEIQKLKDMGASLPPYHPKNPPTNETIDYFWLPKNFQEGDVDLLLPFPNLNHLDFSRVDPPLTDSAFVKLLALKKLQKLHLTGQKASDAFVARLAELPALTTLGLEGTLVTDAGLKSLAAVSKLAELNLERTAVTDAGLSHLAPLQGLTTLTLRGTRVSDAGVVPLAELKGLKTINLQGTAVSDAGRSKLKESLPGCTIN